MKIASLISKRCSGFFTTSRLAFPLFIASLVGIATAFAAVGFIRLIEFARFLFFDRGEAALGFLGHYAVIFIPAAGGLIVGPIVTFLAPEAKGHGVPEVLKAMLLRGGRIRPPVVIAKALASAVAIGSGASVGREGPIVQVGSALGSSVGQWLHLSESRIKNLVACGAAAGIASVFNAPIAGVMFSLEVILRDFGARTLSTVVISAVSASVVSRIFLGESPAFTAPAYTLYSPFEIFIYLGLGIVSAFAALLFIFTLHTSENLFEKWQFPEWLKPAVGGLGIGMIGFYFPQIFGSGLRVIEDALHSRLDTALLFALIFFKILATSLSLGSGSSGGVFAPALFIGAVLGGTVGRLVFHHMPFEVAPPGAYALVGMASVFSGAAHAPVTAILIVFEMTGDYRMILPIMVAVVASTSLAQFFKRDSIYTEKLRAKGIEIHSLEEIKLLGGLQVRDAMSRDFETVSENLAANKLIEKMSQAKDKIFYTVSRGGSLTGVILPDTVQSLLLEENLEMILAADMAAPVRESCMSEDSLIEAAQAMRKFNLIHMPVMDSREPSKVEGVLKSEDIFRVYTDLSAKRSELLARAEHEPSQAAGMVSVHFIVSGRSAAAGREIRSLDLPEKVVLTSIKRGRQLVIPEGGTVLEAKDKVWAVMTREREPEMLQWLAQNGLKIFY